MCFFPEQFPSKQSRPSDFEHSGKADEIFSNAPLPTGGRTQSSMRIFDPDGFYRSVVASNVALHRQAGDRCANAMRELQGPNITVLDLACGGAPIAIANAFERLPNLRVRYIGIDNNPGQVSLASRFSFPQNTEQTDIRLGDAWDLSTFPDQSVDAIYVGLNLHHAVPEEIAHFAKHSLRVLRKGGIFFNHDSYRPEGTTRVQRPDFDPNNPHESFVLIPNHRREVQLSKDFSPAIPAVGAGERDWREKFVSLFCSELLNLGADPIGVEQTRQHIWARDFSLTYRETQILFQGAGFKNIQGGYFEPQAGQLAGYYGTLSAKKPVSA